MSLLTTISKGYQIQFENRSDYLLAKVHGKDISLTVARSFWMDIVREATLRQPKRLLVWEDFPEMLSTIDTFLLIKELCKLEQFKYLRIAYVDEHRDQLIRNQLGEMIACNSGFKARVFTNCPDAEKWLVAE